MNQNLPYADAVRAIRAANRIVLASHVNPDGDTLGSSLALAFALRSLGKMAIPLSHDGVPEILKWMPGVETVETETSLRDFDLAIVCDTGTTDRIGQSKEAILSAPVSICIDHHVTEGEFGQIRIVDSKSSSTGELMFDLIQALEVELTPDMANCLLCAIITDTGSFRYMNVTPRTFEIAAALMSAGASPAEISELVFENRSLASVKLLGRALESLKTAADGRVAWAHVSAKDFEELNATDEETEGIVNHVRAVRTAHVGVLFRETPNKKIRISLRSRPGFDVNQVANMFGGGGHHLAAGCSQEPPLETAEETVIAEIVRRLEAS
ncbi:MAG: bifunctional oligoribonuclease/PAP phosphatase NrnA [Chthonomonadales bacterium]